MMKILSKYFFENVETGKCRVLTVWGWGGQWGEKGNAIKILVLMRFNE